MNQQRFHSLSNLCFLSQIPSIALLGLPVNIIRLARALCARAAFASSVHTARTAPFNSNHRSFQYCANIGRSTHTEHRRGDYFTVESKRFHHARPRFQWNIINRGCAVRISSEALGFFIRYKKHRISNENRIQLMRKSEEKKNVQCLVRTKSLMAPFRVWWIHNNMCASNQ